MENFSEFTKFTKEIALKSGEILMEYYVRDSVEIERKGYNDIATAADKASEKALIDAIYRRYPSHSVLAEESGLHEKESSYRWIIDPLDGTNNFNHKLPIFSVSIALEAEGEIHCGVVYNPYIDELYIAEKGKGAFLNNKSIKVTDTDEKELSLLATGFQPKPEVIDKNLKMFNRFMKEGYLIRRFGSASIDLSFVGSGRYDGFWEFKLNPWDIAAGILIVKEAGGKVTDIEGKPISLNSDSIVASNGRIHEEMLKLIKETN